MSPLFSFVCCPFSAVLFQHIVTCHSNTLLPQFLAMYRVTVESEDTYLLVMRNMFSHRLHVHRKYDLKVKPAGRFKCLITGMFFVFSFDHILCQTKFNEFRSDTRHLRLKKSWKTMWSQHILVHVWVIMHINLSNGRSQIPLAAGRLHSSLPSSIYLDRGAMAAEKEWRRWSLD